MLGTLGEFSLSPCVRARAKQSNNKVQSMEILGCAVAFCCGVLLRILMHNESAKVDEYVRKVTEFAQDVDKFCAGVQRAKW